MGDLFIIIGILAGIGVLYHRRKRIRLIRQLKNKWSKEDLDKLNGTFDTTHRGDKSE